MSKYQSICELCGDSFEHDIPTKKRCSKVHTKKCENAKCGLEFTLAPKTKITTVFCSSKCKYQAGAKPRICISCGKEFRKSSKTCSLKCSKKVAIENYKKNAPERKCELCQKSFKPSSPTQRYCANSHSRNCEICGNEFSFENPLSKKKYCNSKCASIVTNGEEAKAKRRATSLERYGTESPQNTPELKQKIIDANIAKYGVEHPMMLKEMKEKIKSNNMEKYGIEYTLQVPEIRERIGKTNIEKYGSKNPFGSSAIQEKIKETILEKYGHEWANQSEVIKEKRTTTNMDKYGVPNVMMLEENVAKSQETFFNSVNNGNVKHPKVSLLNRKFADTLKKTVTLLMISNSSFRLVNSKLI